MAETHELRLKINAAAAKTGSREFVGAIQSIKNAVATLDRDTDGTFSKLRKGTKVRVDTKAIKGASVDLDKASAGVKRFKDAATRASLSAAQALRTSTGEANRLAMALTDIGDTSGVERINASLTDLQRQLQRASTPLDVRVARNDFKQVEAQLRDLEQTQRRAATAAQSHADRLDSLRSKYNPVYAASKTYERALEEIAEAERLSAISSAQAADARQRAAQQLSGASAAANQYASAMQRSAATTQQGVMVGHQLSDVLITSQMGFQSVGMIALQQGSQLAAQMNALKASGGNVFRTLLAGMTSLINPLSLITIGSVAAGAAIAKWFFAAGQEAETLKDRLKSLNDIQSSLTASTDILKMSVSDLAAEYGTAAPRVRDFAAFQATLKLAELTDQLSKQTSVLQDVSKGYITTATAGGQFRDTILKLQSDFGFTRAAAIEFESALQQAATAATFEEQVSALQQVKALLNESGIEAGSIPPELAAALREMLELSNETDATRKLMSDLDAIIAGNTSQTDDWANRMAGVRAEISAIGSALANIGGTAINNAAMNAELTALNEGRSIRDAEIARRRFEAESEFAAREAGAGSGVGGFIQRQIIGFDRAQFEEQIRLENELEAARERARENERAAGGGGRVKRLKDQEDALKSLTQQWVEAVPTMKEAGDIIERDVLDSLAGSIEKFAMTGQLSFEDFASSVLATMTRLASELAVLEIFNAFGIDAGSDGGGIADIIGGFLGFEHGGTTSAPANINAGYSAPLSAFRHAPSYAVGTPNTSGIPAILHDNEAVVPLSGNRKIPVEMNSEFMARGGGTIQTINMTVNTPDADSFRKSQTQIESELAASGQRSLSKNG